MRLENKVAIITGGARHIGAAYARKLAEEGAADSRMTSAMIIDATRPLDRPFSPVSKCPDEALRRVKLEDYLDQELLQRIPVDRTTYWC